MTITLNQLISELSNIDEVKQTVQNKYEVNILPDFFKDILTDSINRHGVVQNFKSSTRTLNISLYYSILFLIDKNFEKLDEYKQIDNINILVNKLCTEINTNSLITKYNYRELKLKKKDLINEISNYLNTNKVIKFLSDYFDINIFVCNFEHNKLYCACDNNFYNKYRNNIIIGQINSNSFEPLLTNDYKIFSSNNSIINNLLCNHFNYIIPMYGYEFIIKSDIDINHDFHIIEEKNVDEKNVDEKNVDNKNVDEKNVDNKNVDEKNVDEKNVDNKNIDEKNVDNKNEQNVDEKNVEEKNVDNKNEQNVIKTKKYSIKNKLNELQNLAKLYNINLKKTINGKDKSKTKSEIILDLDIYFSKK